MNKKHIFTCRLTSKSKSITSACNSIQVFVFCNGCPVTTGPFGVWKREAHVRVLRCVTVFDKMAVESELCKLRSWNVVILDV